MNYKYCAKINDSNIVEWVVCSPDADWCSHNLGGRWQPVYDDNYCGIGWAWNGEKFIPPPEIEGEE